MPYLVLVHATFETQANADHVFDQTKSVATNASVARIGEAGERTSYAAVYDEQPDGTLVPLRQFHIDRFGIVRPGQLLPDDQIPLWVQPTGAQDAYPLLDVFGNPTRTIESGLVWENTSPANTNKPGVFGWVQV